MRVSLIIYIKLQMDLFHNLQSPPVSFFLFIFIFIFISLLLVFLDPREGGEDSNQDLPRFLTTPCTWATNQLILCSLSQACNLNSCHDTRIPMILGITSKPWTSRQPCPLNTISLVIKYLFAKLFYHLPTASKIEMKQMYNIQYH
jgi:hypothetical protein